jgi:hypothetical protein
LGRFPVVAELRMQARKDASFPSHSVWGKLGSMSEIPAKFVQYCSTRPDLLHLVELCERAILPPNSTSDTPSETPAASAIIGYVYLIKFRSDFKIGASSDPERRYGEIATQMPASMSHVHTIKTDDPFGVEVYWHRRFEAKRLLGEWFSLSPTDVRAFKRWKNIF